MNRGSELYKEAKRIIPGGTQLLSKRPEMFLPDLWPAYYSKAKGCYVWDLEGKRYIDVSHMAVGSCILGYAAFKVNRCVKKAVDDGSMSTLNCPEEVELAQLLCKIHPWAQMARFARCGGEAMSIAVRIARAHTGKDVVLFCGYHGWHDWYLSANLRDDKGLDAHLLKGLEARGVPRGLYGTAIPFSFNDLEGFKKRLKEHKNKIAAVVMEPIRNFYPQKGYLEFIRKATHDEGIVFIFDEITSGWRLHAGGAHMAFKVYPDMAVFAKAMSNGYPMAAIIGRSSVMESAQDTFISSTYWTEKIGFVAALTTIKELRRLKAPVRLKLIGKRIQQGWIKLAIKHGLLIEVGGIYPLSHFSFKYDNALALKTLFTKSMLEKGFLATTSFYASLAHDSTIVEKYLNAVDKTFAYISKVMKAANLQQELQTPVCQSGFERLN